MKDKELMLLLEEVLKELVSCFRAKNEDDEDYLNSLIERAEELGVKIC